MSEFFNHLKKGIALDFNFTSSENAILKKLKHHQALKVQNNHYYLKEDYCIGRFSSTRKSCGFIESLVHNFSKDWLVERHFIKATQNGDIVLAKRVSNHIKRKVRAKILEILQICDDFVLAYLEKYDQNCLAISLPNEIPYKIKASQKSLKTLPQGTLFKLNPQSGEILEILGTLQEPQIDEKIALNLFGRQEDFSLESEAYLKTLPKKVLIKDFKERTNLTHLPFCAIDPVDAKDYDDAIFYDEENSTLYVAIADVSHYVLPDSPLDKDAKKRGFSVYFPHKSIPMLPKVLSENLCSLKEGEVRLAMVWKMRLHKRTKVVLNAQLFEALIKVAKGLSYEKLDEILEKKPLKTPKKSIQLMLQDCFNLTQKLRKNRLKQGFDFLNEEQKIKLDSYLELKSIQTQTQSPSHSLVEECMLLANIQSALLLQRKTTPIDKNIKAGIYRSHPKPKSKDLENLFGELRLLGLWDKKAYPKSLEELHTAILKIQKLAQKSNIRNEVDKLIIKSMQQAFYSSYNIGHFGLGFKAYSHFTSPIRRYADLILHRILKAKITMQEDFIFKNSMIQVCEQISRQEREVAKIELDFKDRKFTRYLSRHIGQTYEAVVISSYQPLLVSLCEAPLMGARVVILKGAGIKYQKVIVQIIETNLATAKIYGRIVKAYSDEQISSKLFYNNQYLKPPRARKIKQENTPNIPKKSQKTSKKSSKKRANV
ncbi:MAG: VacB/RNase II family 3'-5' exoribonuclease [Helicobacter sp.]|nr:VacB/RNase II family 3'-5' exoribonuclease [Helicobacter sp.]